MTTATSPLMPRSLLAGAITLIGVTVALVAGGRLLGDDFHAAAPAGAPLAARALTFADRADGAVTIRDAASGAPIAVVAPETNAFLRATLRGLATARQNIRPDPAQPLDLEREPFRLTAWPDGRLVLADDATGRSVDLEAFGPTNESAFARLLPLAVIPQPSADGGTR